MDRKSVMDIQEDFKNYVFDHVKAKTNVWWYDCVRSGSNESPRTARDIIIDLRRDYAKENRLKTLTPICPKPKDLVEPTIKFVYEYVEKERTRLTEEFKPMTIKKVINDSTVIDRLNKESNKCLSEYESSIYNGFMDYVERVLRNILEEYFEEVKHELGDPPEMFKPCFYRLAKELSKSLFTPSLVLKDSVSETTEKVA